MKQVEKLHYEFSRYMDKARWNSVWHQVDEIVKLQPGSVLEVGPGPGLFKVVASRLGLNIETLDVDPELEPNHVGSATEMPLADESYDVVCAFQVLEHLPYERSLQAFSEMARVSRRHVVISLPDAKPMWRYQFHVPKLGSRDFLVSRPMSQPLEHRFDGEHYWEVSKKGYELARVAKDLGKICKVNRTYRVLENPYHRFFIFEKHQSRADR